MKWVVTLENKDVDGGRPRRVGELRDMGPADAIEAARLMVGATTCGDAVSVMSPAAWKQRSAHAQAPVGTMYNFAHGGRRGENAPRAKLTADVVRRLRREAKAGTPAVKVARRAAADSGVAFTTILNAIQGRTWAWLQ